MTISGKTYFECLACGVEHEVNAPLPKCPACGSGNGITSPVSRVQESDSNAAECSERAGDR